MPTEIGPVTRAGDIWLMGAHRIMCGDARKSDDAERLLQGVRINLGFTSPPYASQRVYDPSSGFRPVPPDQYVEWFAPVARSVRDRIADDGSWFVNIRAAVDLATDPLAVPLYAHDLVVAHVREWGWNYAADFCWRRPAVPKHVALRFKNAFEPIYQFTRGRWKIRPNAVRTPSRDSIAAAGPGSGRRDWSITQGVTFGAEVGTGSGFAYPSNLLPTYAGGRATGHPAAFPVGLPRFFIKAYSDPGDAVYDPFMGSGSTLIAGDRQGRVVYGMEISPRYVDLICKRYLDETGFRPVNERTGQEFPLTEETS